LPIKVGSKRVSLGLTGQVRKTLLSGPCFRAAVSLAPLAVAVDDRRLLRCCCVAGLDDGGSFRRSLG